MKKKTIIGDKKIQKSTVEGGVSVAPMPTTMGDRVTISYDGLLAKSGAEQVFAHVGYGMHNSWDRIADIPMNNGTMGWTCDVIPEDTRLNFCFYDNAQNWDNNNGINWSFTIHNGQIDL